MHEFRNNTDWDKAPTVLYRYFRYISYVPSSNIWKSLTERKPRNGNEVWWRNLFLCTTWRVNHLIEINESVGIGTEPGQQSAPHNQIVPRVGLGGVNWQCHYPYLPSKKRQVIQKQIYWIRILAFVENIISTLTKVSYWILWRCTYVSFYFKLWIKTANMIFVL